MHSARLSIPRDTVVDIPGYGTAKINSAFAYGGPALAVKTVEEFLGIQVNHVLVSTSPTSRSSSTRWAASTYTGSCVVSFISGGFRNGGFTLRLPSGTHHLDGAQALALARTRENQCNPRETDLTREVRQQKLLLDMKSQILSFSGFIRLPWIAWALPQALETDMDAPTLAGVLARARARTATRTTAILYPTGADVPAASGLTITQAAKQADVARFLRPRRERVRRACSAAAFLAASRLELVRAAAGVSVVVAALARRRVRSSPRSEPELAARRRLLALALLRAVVGVVEAAALEVDRRASAARARPDGRRPRIWSAARR